MDDNIFQHVLDRVANAAVSDAPYPHFFVENVFPEEFYQTLLAHLPSPDLMTSLAQTEKVTKGFYLDRFITSLGEEELLQLPFDQFLFWSPVAQFLNSEPWISMLLNKFAEPLKNRFASQLGNINFTSTAELLCDKTNYSIGPHTDHPVRVLTLLFYFPETTQQSHMGTSIYRPKEKTFECEGFTHYPAERFERIYTAPFLPNSLFGFFKNTHSFHGVEPITETGVERRLMNYYLRWNHNS
ncbi:MAG: hypothetical protein V4492_01845 [Chlamydiota bacterium]